MKTSTEEIIDAVIELKAKAVELGIGEYFDGLDSTEILVMGLYRWEKYLETNLKGIKEDMEIDSESDEPVQTEVYQDIDPITTYGSFPADVEEWDDLIEETDYLEEDDE